MIEDRRDTIQKILRSARNIEARVSAQDPDIFENSGNWISRREIDWIKRWEGKWDEYNTRKVGNAKPTKTERI